jgi:hypothetical protein
MKMKMKMEGNKMKYEGKTENKRSKSTKIEKENSIRDERSEKWK